MPIPEIIISYDIYIRLVLENLKKKYVHRKNNIISLLLRELITQNIF